MAVGGVLTLPSSDASLRGTPSDASTAPIRLAILETDTPQPKTLQRVGRFRDVFTALLSQATISSEPPRDMSQVLSITSYDVVYDTAAYPRLEDVDAILITGSRHTAYDDDAWILRLVDFVQRAIRSGRVRVIGVCFGHQIVGRAMGARLGRADKGWEVAVTEIDLTDKGRDIFQLEKLRIHQMHRDCVVEFPRDAIPLGHSDFCSVQAMYSPGQYLTVQGHPEYTKEILSELLYNRHAGGIFSDALYRDGMRRAVLEHDGVRIAQAFINFMKHG